MDRTLVTEVVIPGVGTVSVPTHPMPEDFPNLDMTHEEICLRIHALERRLAALERGEHVNGSDSGGG